MKKPHELNASSLRNAVAFCILTILLITPAVSSAYIGPGAGLSAIGTIVALFGAVLLVIVGFVWYPIKRLLGLRKARSTGQEEEGSDEDSEPPQRTESEPK